MSLTVERTSPTTLTITRRFKAPPERVFAAHVEPELIQRWCYGFEGWRMPVCINDARPGGDLRWEWANDEGAGFHVTGTYEVVEPPRDGQPGRIVHVERMHLPDPTPDNHIETTFAPDGDGTLLTVVMRVDSPEAMEAMIATGMTDGMEVTYARIDSLEREAA
ncbi:SRPBCC domain-containing protein [Rubellimicrobium aerolatum]|uniref:SRPBCC domain-containing protein n=1 Tax=Rubellimicrobium aerolatum TaxID=490979 RepID=A0ABW0SFG6_9RHOB|nr:SRPBCC domain-containing protein [Rubellimicrobium aerolatum]MBP1807127.1 uncharacterized protein YndB with AHSA1/START domain [Rubellimicrobium aerolatum]